MKPVIKYSFTIGLTVILSITLYGAIAPARAAAIWYVSPTGDNDNTCAAASAPCATIQGALGKAAASDTIRVAAGTYTASVTPVVSIEKAITLSGGWDSAFSTRTGISTVDGQNTRQPMYISSNGVVFVEYFSFENSLDTVGIDNFADLTLDHCVVQNNHGGSWGGGITNMNKLTVRWSTIRGNFGHGIFSNQFSGPLVIENSTISENEGSGIYLRTQDASIVNTTISGNFNSGEGGGINFMGSSDHTVLLKNVTIAFNRAVYEGGGIYQNGTYGGQLQMTNTIVSDNVAQQGMDCVGPITSLGYNLVSDTTGCAFSAGAGDQLDAVAKLGALQDNGGPTFTHWLYADSAAIDGGDLAGCTNGQGSPLILDQRGFTRPLDGDEDGVNRCDIGAFEADPANLPPPIPQTIWYVTTQGSDANDCLSPSTPCATINGAIGKAIDGDTIYVSQGVFVRSSGVEVVLVNKDLTLTGGWDLGFTALSGYSELNGENLYRGITIQNELVVYLEGFNIYNGLSTEGSSGGGGIYLGGYSKLIASNLYIHNNSAGNGIDPVGPNGGGIFAEGSAGKLVLNNSLVMSNFAFQDGGGIYSYSKPLFLDNTRVIYNVAMSDGGGISSESADLTLTNSDVSYNGSSNSDRGGGIFHFAGYATIKDSKIRDNVTAGEGGGMWVHSMTFEHSELTGNSGSRGGAIFFINGEITVKDSLIMGNHATYDGGGVLCTATFYLINSSVLFNQAGTNGGGFYGCAPNASNATIAENTAGNSGGGVSYGGTYRNSILANNHAATGNNCASNVTSAGYNLFGDTSGCTITSGPGDILDGDPNLTFFLYGWPLVMGLGASSPAIDGGNPAGCADHLGSPITTDQIGVPRTVDGDKDGVARCDIGAAEYLPYRVSLPLVGR